MLGVSEVRGQGAARGIEAAICELCLEHARSARCHEDSDAVPPVLLGRRAHSTRKAVELEPELREAIVAAIKGCKASANRTFIEVRNLTDVRFEVYAFERARSESRALLAQRFGNSITSSAEAVYDRDVRDV